MRTTLSHREMQVAELLAWGYTDKEVAHQLFVSFNTIRKHRQNIYDRLNLQNLADLTRWYFAETEKLVFGIKPVLRKILAIFFLCLAISIEYFHIDAMRARTARVRTETIARRGKRKKRKTLKFV